MADKKAEPAKADTNNAPEQQPLPGVAPPTAAPDSEMLKIVRGLQQDVQRIQESSKAQVEEANKRAQTLEEQLSTYTKRDAEDVQASYDKMDAKAKALVDAVREKMTPGELKAYVAHLAPADDDAPPPGVPRGNKDGNAHEEDDDFFLPRGAYEPKHAKIVKTMAGMELEHIKETVHTSLPGAKIFQVPLSKFQQMVRSVYGNDGSGKPSKIKG